MSFQQDNQPDSNEPNNNPSSEYAGAGSATATMPDPPAPATPPASATPPAPTPTARHPRAGRKILAAVAGAGALAVGAALFFLAIAAAMVIGLIAGFAIQADAEDMTHAPTTIEEIPTSITSEQADVTLDLSAFSAQDFTDRSEPLPIDIDIDSGSVQVIVPEDLSLSVDADTDIGSTTVFNRDDNGFDNRIVINQPAADIDLTIDVDAGDIDVDRG